MGLGSHRYTPMPGPCWRSPKDTPACPWVPGSLSRLWRSGAGAVGAYSSRHQVQVFSSTCHEHGDTLGLCQLIRSLLAMCGR